MKEAFYKSKLNSKDGGFSSDTGKKFSALFIILSMSRKITSDMKLVAGTAKSSLTSIRW